MKTQTKTAFLLPIIITILTISGCAGEQTHLPPHPIKDYFLHRTSENEVPEEEGPEQHLHLKITDSGYDVFTPTRGVSFDYRYGPSVMLHDDGSMDAWFAIPADGVHEMDWVTYRHSDDSGKTWSDEKVVISPTPGSKDELSICDPDVFYYDGYYYLGYTSTMDITKQGLCNSFYLARSPQPDGPFEKWDGAGWGGDPEPVIYYDGVWNGWGVGEPGFVLKDDTLYIYVTDDAYTYAYDRLRTTEVYKADILEPDWPARLSFAGPDRMLEYLDIEPGSLSVMGLMNDREHRVQLLVDEDVLKLPFVGCHPCVNTASLKLKTEDVFGKFAEATGHGYKTVHLVGE